MIDQKLRRYFAGRGTDDDFVAAYLFGSVARGDDDARSDVDVAVLYRFGSTRCRYVWKGRSNVSSAGGRR